MFKFQTTTIINNFVDANGVNKIVSTADSLTIHRLGKFKKANITKVYKKAGTAGTAGTAEITCETSTAKSNSVNETPTAAGIYRLKLYVKLSGNNNAYYSNAMVFKGKPYTYEFEVKESAKTAEDVAKAAEAAINRMASRFNDKVFKVVRAGAKLTITTVGPENTYRSITECVLQKYDCTVGSATVGGEYVDVVEATVGGATNKLIPCVNPFGTYFQIIKDLRLPTAEQTSWTAINQDERPVMGTIYDQYIIYICVNRGVMGGDAVGEITKSLTAHSIWIPSTQASAFEAYLTAMSITPEAYNAEYEAAKGEDTIAGTEDDKPGVSIEPDVID